MKKTPELEERLEILRRIAERGLKNAQAQHYPAYSVDPFVSQQTDLWQHMLDEIKRINI